MKKWLMAILAFPMAALASTTWFVDGQRGSNGFSGLTTFAPKRTIQAAINAAAPGDYVMVAGGVYYENLTLSKRLTLFAYEPATPVVNGRFAGHCLLVTENASDCVVDGFCFEKGAPTNSGNKYGGGIDCLANATIRHCTFRDNGNSSTTFAGGLHTSNGAQVLVENCLFVNNYAWACGGATLTEGNSTATFDRCTVYGNRSDDYIGNEGGISVANTGTAIVRSCILWGNSGMQLAAYGSYFGAQSTIRVSYSCVQGGVAANGAGHFYNDGGNISVNPLFLDIPRRNFWFRDNSPCWRKGHPDYFEADGFRLHMGFWPSRVRPLPPPVWPVTITLNAQDGDCCVPSVKRNVGDFVGLLPIPLREGYDFLGWFDKAEDGRQIFPAEKVLGSRTFYAHWQQKIPPLFQIFGSTSGISSFVKIGMTLEDGAADGKLYLNPVASQPIDEQTPLTSFESASSKLIWQPQKTGRNVFVYKTGDAAVTTKVNVAKLTFATQKDPVPPMPKDANVSISPVVRTIAANGAGKSIIVQGRGKWSATVSDSWIVLGATSGTIPEEDGLDYVAYSVTVNTNIGQRVGYVYVNGYVHTITQAGRGGATLSTDNITCECEGGSADIDIDFSGRYAWDARPNDDWITVTPTHGTGAGTISCSIAPLNEVATRQGSITIGDMTVTVFQYGRRMKLYPTSETRDYYTHVIPIDVAGLALTTWDVTPNASWISIVDAGRGKGSDAVTIAIGENPSWRTRSGTVTIGTETFTITQKGRTNLEFAIDPVATTASVNGANGHIAVTGTPDLPWSAESKANWLTVLGSTASGSGNGNVFYTASPNSTLLERTGTIVITPADKSLKPVTHTVRQPGAVAVLSPAGYEFEAAGETAVIEITVPGSVTWNVSEKLDWLSVQGSLTRTGSGAVTLQAAPNNTVQSRSGKVQIAGHDITVTQKGRGFELDYENVLFGTDGDQDSFSVFPDGDMAWEAVASDSWIKFMYGSNVGSGYGEVIYNVGPYVGDGSSRTGWIQIGEQKVYVTQRAYDLSISPTGKTVSGNAGAGEIAVSAGIGDVWHAIRTEPWITIESGTDEGSGSGTVRFSFTDNDTGKTRTGKIIIDGAAYTLTQASRVLVNVDASVLGHGHVEGSGTHSLGEKVTLTAVADAGYSFAYWTGAVGETMQNPIVLTADVAKSVTATFEPLAPEFVSTVSSEDGVHLTWSSLAWASEYRIYRAPTGEKSSAPMATIFADGSCSWLDETGDQGKQYWYWVEAIGADAKTESKEPGTGRKLKPEGQFSITYSNLHGTVHGNPSTYMAGTSYSFSEPGNLTGYSFAGWEPTGFSSDARGDLAVTANWTANRYRIVYDANSGSGETLDTECEYDISSQVAACGFSRRGYAFGGWSAERDGAVVYAAGQPVSNLTSENDGTVTLYAVWTPNAYSVAFNANGGDGTMAAEGFEYDEAKSLGENLFVKTGYGFAGWSTNATGSVKFADGEIVSNLTEKAGATINLYAKWTANGYTVAFNANGGSGSMEAEAMTYDTAKALTICSFMRPGYTFAGWATSAGGAVNYANGAAVKNLAVSGSVTLFAKWTPNSYVVDFNPGQGGMGVMPGQPMTYDEAVALYANLFTRTGYTFLGWTDDPDEVEEVLYYDGVVVENLTDEQDGEYDLYAVWAVNEYKVRFNANGGVGTMADMDFLYDEAQSLQMNSFVRTGYAFAGWATSAGGAVKYLAGASVKNLTAESDGVVTLYAKWMANAYTVKFNANGGEGAMADLACTYGTAKALPACVFTRTGYVFAGWAKSAGGAVMYADRANVTDVAASGSATLYAKWTPIAYSVKFDANGGSGTMANEPMTYDVEKALTVCAFTKTGYAFAGWAVGAPGGRALPDGANAMNLTSTQGEEVALYAKWTANAYSVKFNSNGGTGTMANEAMTYDAAKALTACSFTRTGYTFAGWATSAGGAVKYANGAMVKNLAVSGSVTLFAKWTPNSYVVDFNPGQGGMGVMPGQPMTYDEAVALYANLFTRTGYTFLGWTDDPDEVEEVLYYDGVVVENLTSEEDGEYDLYAIWAANEYTVRFNANGGTGTMAEQPMTYDVERALRSNGFTRTGYVFAGWATSAGGAVKYLAGASVKNLTAESDGVVTLYAKWTANQYTVRFNANGGAGTMADQAFVYDAGQAVKANSFTRKGYAFAGWATSANGAVKYGPGATIKNLAASGVTTLYAKWTVVQYSIGYVLGGGTNARTNPKTYTVEDAVALAVPTRAGWLFDGWEPAGTIVKGTTGALTFTAKWHKLPEVDAQTGTLAFGPELAGLRYGPLPAPTSSGRVFLGWAKDREGKSFVSADEVIPKGGVTLYPIWQMTSLWPVDGAFSAVAANVYDGILWDGKGIVGSVQVKTAKQSVKKTTDRVTKAVTMTTNITATATVTDANGKKWSYSKGAVTVDGIVSGLKCTTKGCPVAEFGVALGRNGLEGEWGAYEIHGARNGMGVKGDAMMSKLEAYKGKWSVTIGTLRLQLNVQAKGAVKIAGNWESGAKVSASAQLAMGDGFVYVPVAVKATKTSPALNALIRIAADGEVALVGEGELVAGGLTVEALGTPTYEPSAVSKGGAAFRARVAVNELAYPAKFAAKGLPSGLKIDAATGVISGTPTKPGHYVVTVTVTSGLNSKVKKTLTVGLDIANYTDAAIPIADAYGPYRVGVAVNVAIPKTAGCKVSGLPAGLKWTEKDVYDKKSGSLLYAAGSVYGVPTKAGSFTVYFKLTRKETVGGKLKSVTHQASATFTVDDLDSWAQGTFRGDTEVGPVTLTVGKTGKVSGKWTSEGQTWTFSAASYDAYVPSERTYLATVQAKSGKETKMVEVEVRASGADVFLAR